MTTVTDERDGFFSSSKSVPENSSNAPLTDARPMKGTRNSTCECVGAISNTSRPFSGSTAGLTWPAVILDRSAIASATRAVNATTLCLDERFRALELSREQAHVPHPREGRHQREKPTKGWLVPRSDEGSTLH